MKNKQAKINYADLWGLREEKYKFLEENDVKTTKWQELQPKESYYFLVPKNFRSEYTYNKFLRVLDIYGDYRSGVSTLRDHFVVAFNKHELIDRMNIFKSNLSDDLIKSALNLKDTRDWNLHLAREKFIKNNFEENIYLYSYRSFDSRLICYDQSLFDRGCSRIELMSNFFEANLGLILRRTSEKEWHHCFITDSIMDMNYLEARTYVFPLYLYENKADGTLFENEPDKKGSNLKVEFIALLNQAYNPQPVTTPLNKQKTFDILPEQIFNYIYAILYSNIYRQKYQEFLKIDFPRIPFTKDYNLFKKLAELGEQLVNLHLLKSPELNNPISKFHGGNGNRVEKREYNEKEKRVYVNGGQYFENIHGEVWNYYIGGYQVLDKWLKDRKGRTLSSEDVKHYCKVVSALSKTIELQKNINELYPRIEESFI